MDLAKPRIDVGLFTTNLEPMLDFWQNEIGLPFDHPLPLGGGLQQHRHDLLGSVLKINHARNALPDASPSGYRELLIAREGLLGPKRLTDPDGNLVTLVPSGTHGIERIGIRLGVRDAAAHRRFYAVALGLPDVPERGGDSFICGDSVILFDETPDASGDAIFEGPGFRYITIQIRNVDEEHAAILAHGGKEGRAPQTLGKVARISFVRDPDGNWIEMSQRASLVGALD
ncbi:Glyoxalase/bleomycin resistance protein/dioxygenase [Parvibaculum lavamentivorans DS-1]|uniref:Glyoxalase/bleomycin resistance protein/dioxygenase n=1 Tax=Parvibaculum lavamentivorans (strain DS-1 / DSM 13023 / NCIMB 13966) TaxID=402881 RepID=A7HUN9_PARL1|nr:VOC family protein [Parvibaculum lavamentivorans]ABS63622.1 Glyoxalase/bleomycin resistance protein/dioxygenase [Parvibaculum lavamentivorans DS-1]